ncbi:hypothetical protein X801_08589 [Opisthorchis viverrini]|nr:hypothetical protein X801_08589 [Opisthorchis viverrini]
MLFAEYYLHGDYTMPQFMGVELGELLKVACESELAPIECRAHAVGGAAEAGFTELCRLCKSRLCKSTDRLSDLISQSSDCSSYVDAPLASSSQLRPPPLVVIFSRILDDVIPMLFPMKIETFIRKTIGIVLGRVELSDSACSDKSLRKQLLKATRHLHTSCVFKKLEEWGTKLQDTCSGLEF